MIFRHCLNTFLPTGARSLVIPNLWKPGLQGSKRTSIYYCDPMRSGQKGGLEQAHTMLRMILPKKTNFEFLTQWDVYIKSREQLDPGYPEENKSTERESGIMAILVTGGAGYIGSHTCVELQNAGYDVVVLDNLSNASEKSLDRVEALTGKKVTFYKGDILDRDILNKIFAEQKIESCIHFAGLKAVGESVAKPWEYYNNNIAGTLTLVDVMRQNGCQEHHFLSSEAVYSNAAEIPITENCPKCKNMLH